jgi:flagellar secretion chaperone FliS
MNPYFEQTILNADPTELTRMVYQRAIFCVRDAREHLRNKRIAGRSAAIMRAYCAIEELVAALRPELAPELAARLQSLYLYMQQRLLDANIQQSDPLLEEVLGLLVTMAEAWAGVVAKLAPPEAVSDAGNWSQPGPGDISRIAVSA